MAKKRDSDLGSLAIAPAHDAGAVDRYNVGLALKRAQHELRLAINAELEPFGTNISQLNVLYMVKQYPGVSSAELARVAFLTPQTLGQQVIQMQERGLVQRSPGEGRRIRHKLTKAGEQLLVAGMEKVRAVDTKVLQDFDDRGLASLLDAFQTIERRAAEARAHRKRFAPVAVD